MRFFKKYIKKYWRPFSFAIIVLTLEALCDLMQPTIMAKIVDTGVAQKNFNYILNMGLIMLAVTAVGAAAAIIRNIISSHVSLNLSSDLRLDLFKKIQSLSLEGLDKFDNASLITRLTNDITQVQNLTNGLMRIFVKAPLLCIGSIIMAIRLNLHLSLILFIIIPLVGFIIYMNLKTGYPAFLKVQKALDKLNGVMREYLSGVRVVKAFNRYEQEEIRFENTNNSQAQTSIASLRLMSIFGPCISLAVNTGIAAVLWFGSIQVTLGGMHVGQVMAYVNYMTQILFSLMMISFVFTTLVRAQASFDRIVEIFSMEDAMVFRDGITTENKGRIDFENVSFSYKDYCGDPVIKNISFTCMAGETLAVIGSTGSGKSTLINLIPRFYDTCSGKVLVDGMDVRDMDIKVLRGKIALVPQKTVLFTGTILENIKWGRKNASMEEVISAASAAQAHGFISSFPEKYETMLGQGGVNLSGGQKQRLAIARALIKFPEILVLDDCTSSVDTATETSIREALKQYFKKLTCIIVAQRITSVMDADRILVLDEGAIAGIGTHESLMKTCKVYKDIFHSQIGREEF